METIPRAKLSEDEWNRKNHVWKNADPTTRGDGRDFNGIDNYQQYLQSLNGGDTWRDSINRAMSQVEQTSQSPDFVKRELDTSGNYGPVDPSKIIPEPRLNANPGIKNDGTVGGSMPRELRDYFSASGGMPPNSNDPRFGMYRDWMNGQKGKTNQSTLDTALQSAIDNGTLYNKDYAQNWNQNDGDDFGAYLQSFSNGTGTGDSIPKATAKDTREMYQQFQKPEVQKMYNDVLQKLMAMSPEEQVAYARQMGVNI